MPSLGSAWQAIEILGLCSMYVRPKEAPDYFVCTVPCSIIEVNSCGKNCFSRFKDQLSENVEVRISGFQYFQLDENHGLGSAMSPYHTTWAHIQTIRSRMAQDHF